MILHTFGDFSVFDSGACVAGGARSLKDSLNNNQPFPNNLIPTSRFDPSSVKLLQYLHSSADPCGKVQYGIPANNSENQEIGRIDWVQSAKNTIFVRYFIDDYSIPASRALIRPGSERPPSLHRQVPRAPITDRPLLCAWKAGRRVPPTSRA